MAKTLTSLVPAAPDPMGTGMETINWTRERAGSSRIFLKLAGFKYVSLHHHTRPDILNGYNFWQHERRWKS